MNRLMRWVVPGGVALWLLVACATPPEPFEYEPSNELKPGPGIFTGEEGVYTIYGAPPPPAEGDAGAAGEDAPEDPDDPADP